MKVILECYKVVYKALGFSKVTVSKIKDDYQSTLNSLEKIISENDVVLISGGISVGDYDLWVKHY